MSDSQPRSRTFDSRGLALHYLEWGRAEAPPLILLHGGLDSAWTWSELAEPLAADWRVLALDLRGHGDSAWSPGADYHLLSFLGDVAAFAASVGGGRARIVGHSMGARLALLLAGAASDLVERVAAIEGLSDSRPGPPDEAGADPRLRVWVEARRRRQQAGRVAQVGYWLEQRARLGQLKTRPYADADEAVARLLRGEKRLTPAQAALFARANMRPSPEGGLTWKFDPAVKWFLGSEAAEPDLVGYWRAVRAPVLHIYGADSWADQPTQTDLAQFTDARLEIIPGAGHWTHLNQPEAVLAAVTAFLAA